MFDVPLGLTTFARMGVAPLVVVSKQQLAKMGIRHAHWDALALLPVTRDAQGRSDLLAVGGAALASGRSVAIMPEGRVVRDAKGAERSIKSGVAQLASETGVSVVVIGSAGSEQFWIAGDRRSFIAPRRRRPAVVVVHDIVSPSDDLDATRIAIARSMADAEQAAERLRDSLLTAGA